MDERANRIRTALIPGAALIVWRTVRGVLAGRFAADLVVALAIAGAVVRARSSYLRSALGDAVATTRVAPSVTTQAAQEARSCATSGRGSSA